jgi:hypothetical protein
MLRGNLLRRVVEPSCRFAKNGGLFVGRDTEQAQLGAQCGQLQALLSSSVPQGTQFVASIWTFVVKSKQNATGGAYQAGNTEARERAAEPAEPLDQSG